MLPSVSPMRFHYPKAHESIRQTEGPLPRPFLYAIMQHSRSVRKQHKQEGYVTFRNQIKHATILVDFQFGVNPNSVSLGLSLAIYMYIISHSSQAFSFSLSLTISLSLTSISFPVLFLYGYQNSLFSQIS